MLVNRSMPQQVLVPVLGYPDVAEAVEYLSAAFGFVERWRAGDHRAQLQVATGAAVAITQGAPPAGPSVDHVMVRIEDVDTHVERARSACAHIVSEPADLPYGERQYAARDHAGRTWVFTQSVADVAPEDWGAVTRSPR